MFAPLVAGKAAQVTGRLDVPHSVAYIEDVGRAAALLATRDEALGRVWIAPHAPARSQGDLLDLTGEALSRPVGYRVITPSPTRLAGLFNPGARASVEMMYQFTAPFVVASHRFEAHFGLVPTPTRSRHCPHRRLVSGPRRPAGRRQRLSRRPSAQAAPRGRGSRAGSGT